MFLLGRNAAIEVSNASGMTPLHVAVWAGKEDAVRVLLSKNANIEAVCHEERYTLMHLAGVTGNSRMATLLVENMVPLDVRDVDGDIPIFIAILK
jgi:ankyrin